MSHAPMVRFHCCDTQGRIRAPARPGTLQPSCSQNFTVTMIIMVRRVLQPAQPANQTQLRTDNKNFWEELIAYFPLIRNGPQTNENDASNNSSLPHERFTEKLPSNNRGINKPTESPFTRSVKKKKNRPQQLSYCCVNVFREPLFSNDRSGDTHKHTQTAK
jgi:hypothetical protein